MSQLPKPISDLCHRLRELHARPSLFGQAKRDLEIIHILKEIDAATGWERLWPLESLIAPLLLDRSDEVQLAAAMSIHAILRRIPSEQKLDWVIQSASEWIWGSSEAWSRIKPSQLPVFAIEAAVQVSVLGLASLHRNGHVRHEAVHRLARIHDGSELPYLLIRQNDWVAPISADARVAVRERLTEKYVPHLVAHLPLVVRLLRLQRHDHSEMVRDVVRLFVRPEFDDLLANVMGDANRSVRREITRIALGLEGDQVCRVIAHGLSSSDPVIRLRCLKRVPSCISGKSFQDLIDRLKDDPFMAIRREAMMIDADAFPDQANELWQSALFDFSSSLRELAQIRFAKLGRDPAAAYRERLAAHPDSSIALSGLGEVGNQSDFEVIRQHLKATAPRLRRAAIRGIGRIGGEPVVSELLECLRDDSTGVVREARQQLARWPHLLNGESLFQIVENDSRSSIRTAGLRLLCAMGKWESLPWLIRAAGHTDPATAEMARSLVERWFSLEKRNRIFTTPTIAQRKALMDAATGAKLPNSFKTRLDHWVGEI